MSEPLLAPVHPGEVLFEEFLKPMDLSQYRLAREICVPPRRINEIVHGTRSISADTALRLARYFGTSGPILAQPPDHVRPGPRKGSARGPARVGGGRPRRRRLTPERDSGPMGLPNRNGTG